MNLFSLLSPLLLRNKNFSSPPSRLSAVLILLREEKNDIFIPFTRRSYSIKEHQGEVCFPGGKFDPLIDRDPVETALRETEEEIGVPREMVSVAGLLREIETLVTNYTIIPVVGIMKDPHIKYRILTEEIERVFEVPLSFLLNEKNIEEFELHLGNTSVKNFRIFYEGEVIWGATARTLVSFLNCAGERLREYVSHLKK